MTLEDTSEVSDPEKNADMSMQTKVRILYVITESMFID